MARDRERTAGIGEFQRFGPAPAGQPPLQEARHESVPGPEHVEHLDLEAPSGHTIVKTVGDFAVECRCTHRAALAHKRRRRQFPNGPERAHGVGGAAGDVEFLLGADDEVEEIQHRLQGFGDPLGGDEPAVAVPVTGEPPEVGAEIDVQGGADAALPGDPEGLQHRRLGVGVRQMRSGRTDAARPPDEFRINVVCGQRHVGAILPVEDQGKVVVVADAQDHQRREAFRVGPDPFCVHPLALELLTDEASHVLVADARDEPGAKSEPRCPGGNVGGRPADVLAEGGHVLQPSTDLPAVEVNGRPADGDQVKLCFHDGRSANCCLGSDRGGGWGTTGQP